MDIMLESYEAYSIEQQERKKQYLKQFEMDMTNKVTQWNHISGKHERKESLSKEELAFMIREVSFTYDSSVSESSPYLHGHTKRLKEKHVGNHGIEILSGVISSYFDYMDDLFTKELGVFGRKKVIDSGIEKAKEVVKETEELANVAELFLEGHLDFLEKWEEEKRRWEIADHQLLINRPFLPKDIEWMLVYSKRSIEEQVETGKLFFSHHFDRVEKEEHLNKRIQNFTNVFRYYKQAIETVATEPIPLLDTGGHLERMKNHLRNAKQQSGSGHHEVKEYIQKKKKSREE